jgi:cysteine desulfurase/selenocysteine lyase
MFDSKNIRKDFPILDRTVNKKPLIYFDNAATTQKPQVVLDAISNYYSQTNANIHRGVHTLSQEATNAYEDARQKIQKHINAKEAYEVLFTRGTTESINLVANGFSQLLKKGDEIIISYLEHHSNIVPWQLACQKSGATLKVIPMQEDGSLDMEAFENLVSKKTKIVAVNHVSNALGTINDIQTIINKAHQVDAAVLIDGAQAIAHIAVDVMALDCDFYCASAHKMYGPTGVGFLYGKEKYLDKLPPYQGGGEMIAEVTFEKTTYAALPHKFEAGTPNIAAGIVFGTALDYVNTIGLQKIAQYEDKLLDYATKKMLAEIPNLKIYGTAPKKAAVISFNIEGIHNFDLGTIIDKLGVAIRTGHHCTQPIMQYFDIAGTARASFSMYNTQEEIDVFVAAVQRAQKMLS